MFLVFLVLVGFKDLFFVNLSINFNCLYLNIKKIFVELMESVEEFREMNGSNKEVDFGLIKRKTF